MKINLYLPDDKKELYEEVKLYLQKEGKSLSQLFLKCLEEYVKRENILMLKKWKEKLLAKIGNLIPETGNWWEQLYLEREFKLDGKIFDAGLIYVKPTESTLGQIKAGLIEKGDEIPVEIIPVAVIEFLLTKKQSLKDRIEQIKQEFVSNYQSLLARNYIPYFIVVVADKSGDIKRVLVFDIPSFQTHELSKKNITKLSNLLSLPIILKKRELLEGMFSKQKDLDVLATDDYSFNGNNEFDFDF